LEISKQKSVEKKDKEFDFIIDEYGIEVTEKEEERCRLRIIKKMLRKRVLRMTKKMKVHSIR
jgi:hypothetical protein